MSKWRVTHRYARGSRVEFPSESELESLLDTLRRFHGVIGPGESFLIERVESSPERRSVLDEARRGGESDA